MKFRNYLYVFIIVIAGGYIFTQTNTGNKELENKKDEIIKSDLANPIFANINQERIINADNEPDSWLSHGRNYEEQRYSPLVQINKNNIDNLELAWSFDMSSTRALESTPIVVDGTMFLTSEWSIVYAIDAKTGNEVWYYDPEVPKDWGRKACCDVVNRGAAVWKGYVYSATLDGRLIKLDAKTGELVWEIDTPYR